MKNTDGKKAAFCNGRKLLNIYPGDWFKRHFTERTAVSSS